MGFYSFQAGYYPGMYSSDISVWTPGMPLNSYIKGWYLAKKFWENYEVAQNFNVNQRLQLENIWLMTNGEDAMYNRIFGWLLASLTPENADRVIELTKLHNPEWLRAVESRAAKVRRQKKNK